MALAHFLISPAYFLDALLTLLSPQRNEASPFSYRRPPGF